jgi:hypothetical protein
VNLLKLATDKQLKLIIDMELWLKTYNSQVELLDHQSDIAIGDASNWIKSNMDAYKELRGSYSYSDLIKKLN